MCTLGFLFQLEQIFTNKKDSHHYDCLLEVRPPGVEPGSREPESHVRSITLRAQQIVVSINVYYNILF